jgi:hypothetical protein
MRADDFIDSSSGKALISTTAKKNRKGAVRAEVVLSPCLSKICNELVVEYMPLCKGCCYLQCMAGGKLPSIELRDNLGKASYNTTTKRIDYPSSSPASRLPKSGIKKGRKALVGRISDLRWPCDCGVRGGRGSFPNPQLTVYRLHQSAHDIILYRLWCRPELVFVKLGVHPNVSVCPRNHRDFWIPSYLWRQYFALFAGGR